MVRSKVRHVSLSMRNGFQLGVLPYSKQRIDTQAATGCDWILETVCLKRIDTLAATGCDLSTYFRQEASHIHTQHIHTSPIGAHFGNKCAHWCKQRSVQGVHERDFASTWLPLVETMLPAIDSGYHRHHRHQQQNQHCQSLTVHRHRGHQKKDQCGHLFAHRRIKRMRRLFPLWASHSRRLQQP